MATKTPNRTTPRKPSLTKAAAASKTAATEQAAKKEKAVAAAPVPPPPPKEAVSLIDEKPKTVRRRTPEQAGIKSFKPLAAISKILAPAPPKPPFVREVAPVAPEPEPEPVAVAPEPVVEEEVKNEKVVHL